MKTLAVSCKKYAKRMKKFTRHLHVWSVLWLRLLPAVIGLVALSAVSCRTKRVVESHRETEANKERALTEYETLATVMESVGGDSVNLQIPLEVMRNLPDGAAFTKKTGRTRVSLKRQGHDVVAEAETDSLARTATRYERRARDSLSCRGTSTNTTALTKEKSPTHDGVVLVVLLLVLCALACRRT